MIILYEEAMFKVLRGGYSIYNNKCVRLVAEPEKGLDTLPNEWMKVCTDFKVKVVHLMKTGISKFPSQFSQLNLKGLDLRSCGLTVVPSILYQMTTLDLLNLAYNKLEEIEDGICQLTNLEKMWITGNPSLKAIPVTMGHQLKKLKFFRCVGTGLSDEVAPGGAWRLRGWQLSQFGQQALPSCQTGETAIDILVVYQEKDKEVVISSYDDPKDSLCSRIEIEGQCCTPVKVNDTKTLDLGLQNCKVILLCVSQGFPLGVFSEVKQNKKSVIAVRLTKDIETELKEELSKIKDQGLLVEPKGNEVVNEDETDEEYDIYIDLDILCPLLLDLLKNHEDFTPLQIIMRGPTAVKIYHEAATNGLGCDKRFRVIVVGQERSGKTSLVNLLTGKIFNPNEEITHVIDVVNARTRPTPLGTWEVCITEDGSYHNKQEYIAACAIAKQFKAITRQKKENIEKDSEKKSETKEHFSVSHVEESKAQKGYNVVKEKDLSSKKEIDPKSCTELSTQVVNDNQTDQFRDDASLIEESPELAVHEDFIELVKEMVEKDTEDLSESLQEISLWDFGGQYFYYTTHQVFLSAAAIFLVVFDLTKKMTDPATEWIEDGFSNGQVLEFWLDSLYAYTKSTQPLSILLVGTHANQVTVQQINEKFEYIWNLLKKKSYYKMIVQEFFFTMFYAIENSLEFHKNTEANKLKKHIEEVLIPKIMNEREKRPLRWLEFEKCLRTSQNEEHQTKDFAHLDEVKEIAVKCKVIAHRNEEETLMTILQFLHDIGSIIYYGKDDAALKDLVILNIEWLLDTFRKLLIVPRPNRLELKLTDSWEKLKEKHILMDALANHVLGHLKETKSSILHVMKKYDLITERVRKNEVSYYVPFVLVEKKSKIPHISKKEIHRIEIGSDTTFYIGFDGFLPGGLFHRLVIRTLRWSEEECAEAGYPTAEPEIYYRYLAANIDSSHAIVLEWMAQSKIKVSVKKLSFGTNENPEPPICEKVLNFLKRTLQELETMGMRSVNSDLWVDLEDYPDCRALGCGNKRCQVKLQACLDAEERVVPCPKHSVSRINVSPIQAQFNIQSETFDESFGRILNVSHHDAHQSGNQISRTDNDEIFLMDLSQKMGAEWYGVGIYLGLKVAQLETIKASHLDSVETQKHMMLVKWHRKCTEANKVGVLIEALRKVDRHDLADSLS